MRKRVQVAVAVLLVALVGVNIWRGLHKRGPEPVYQGRRLSLWLRDYAGCDTSPEEWDRAKRRAEHAVRQIGTNAIPNLLEMVRKNESPRMSRLISFWDHHIAMLKNMPAWVQHPAWYKNQARYLNMEGEIGFKILGAEAQLAVPELMNIYERTFSMDSLAAMDSQVAVSRALVDIGYQVIAPRALQVILVAIQAKVRQRQIE